MKTKLITIAVLSGILGFIYLNRSSWFPLNEPSENPSKQQNVANKINLKRVGENNHTSPDREIGVLISKEIYYGRIGNSLVKLMFEPDEFEGTGSLYYMRDDCTTTYNYKIADETISCELEMSPCDASKEPMYFIYDKAHNKITGDDEGYKVFFTTENNETPHLTDNEKSAVDNNNSRYSVNSKGTVIDNEPCSLCNGTGIEKNRSSMSNEDRRVCPQCNGTGHEHY